MEISGEVKEAYSTAREFPEPSLIAILCDFARDTLARLRKAEHERLCNNFMGFDVKCDCCDQPDCPNECHLTWEQRQALAERELRGEK